MLAYMLPFVQQKPNQLQDMDGDGQDGHWARTWEALPVLTLLGMGHVQRIRPHSPYPFHTLPLVAIPQASRPAALLLSLPARPYYLYSPTMAPIAPVFTVFFPVPSLHHPDSKAVPGGPSIHRTPSRPSQICRREQPKRRRPSSSRMNSSLNRFSPGTDLLPDCLPRGGEAGRPFRTGFVLIVFGP